MLRQVALVPAVVALGGPQGMLPARPADGQQLRPMPVTEIDQRETTLDSPRRLTLTFAEPQPIEEALQLLVMGTPFSLAIDADVKGSFRGELKQLTLREALTALLAPLGLDFEVHGTVIRVAKHQAQTRLFDLNLLAVQRTLQRTSGPSTTLGTGPSASIATTSGRDQTIDGVVEGVQALLSDTGRVHVDGHAGLVQVTDFPERLERVALYLETLQQRSGRQVRLQSQVFEVTLTGAAPIDWRAVRGRLGLRADAASAGMAADPRALRAALAAEGEIRDLWAPDVTALNNEPALVRIATAAGPWLTITVPCVVRLATPVVSSLTMTVVPQVSADGVVQLSVSHAWEEMARVTESD